MVACCSGKRAYRALSELRTLDKQTATFGTQSHAPATPKGNTHKTQTRMETVSANTRTHTKGNTRCTCTTRNTRRTQSATRTKRTAPEPQTQSAQNAPECLTKLRTRLCHSCFAPQETCVPTSPPVPPWLPRSGGAGRSCARHCGLCGSGRMAFYLDLPAGAGRHEPAAGFWTPQGRDCW